MLAESNGRTVLALRGEARASNELSFVSGLEGRASPLSSLRGTCHITHEGHPKQRGKGEQSSGDHQGMVSKTIFTR